MRRPEFSAARKQAALERSGHRCQDPQCGISAEWGELLVALAHCGLALPCRPSDYGGWTQQMLLELRDLLMANRFRFPRALNPIIKRFKLDGGALLEVDHELECADGGTASLDNATVRCVFCHAFKTRDRDKHRRRTPHKAAPDLSSAQTSVLTEAKLAPLREKIDAMKSRSGEEMEPRAATRSDAGKIMGLSGISGKPGSPEAPPRRHFSETEWAARMAEKARALEDTDGFWGA